MNAKEGTVVCFLWEQDTKNTEHLSFGAPFSLWLNHRIIDGDGCGGHEEKSPTVKR